eukprot:scaffold39424_cov82-Phaeocystis_antarctica.AAC.1
MVTQFATLSAHSQSQLPSTSSIRRTPSKSLARASLSSGGLSGGSGDPCIIIASSSSRTISSSESSSAGAEDDAPASCWALTAPLDSAITDRTTSRVSRASSLSSYALVMRRMLAPRAATRLHIAALACSLRDCSGGAATSAGGCCSMMPVLIL